MPDATHYTYRVAWSAEDGEHVAFVVDAVAPSAGAVAAVVSTRAAVSGRHRPAAELEVAVAVYAQPEHQPAEGEVATED